MKRFFAKLHLWLALPFGIVVTILCLTGAILVFESEIKEWTQPSLYRASSQTGKTLPFGEIVGRARTQLPDTVGISSIQVSSSPQKNYRLGVAGERRTSVMVDPYTGDVRGVIRPYERGNFFTVVRRLHRWFLMEVRRDGISWGKMITGVSTLVFVFILISGIIIWVPKTWKGVRKRLSIKTGAGRFRFWYDFHLSLGKMSSVLLLAMALTGLTWSFNWYRNGFYKVFGVEVTQQQGGGAATATHGGSPAGGHPEGEDMHGGNSAAGESGGSSEYRGYRSEGGRPAGGMPDEERGHRPEAATGSGRAEGGESRGNRGNRSGGRETYGTWEKAVASLREANPGFRTITVQAGTATVASKRYGNTRASDSYTFDSHSGEITGVSYYKNQPKSTKIRGWIYAVHVGSWGGIYTKILYFMACIVGAVLPVTGYYIWLKKRWKKWIKNRRTPVTV